MDCGCLSLIKIEPDMANSDLREKRKVMFLEMEQKLKEMHTKEDDSLFYYHSSEVFNPCIIAVPSLEGL